MELPRAIAKTNDEIEKINKLKGVKNRETHRERKGGRRRMGLLCCLSVAYKEKKKSRTEILCEMYARQGQIAREKLIQQKNASIYSDLDKLMRPDPVGRGVAILAWCCMAGIICFIIKLVLVLLQ